MPKLIPHAHIINPDKNLLADIRIENGKIIALEKAGTLIPAPGDEVIDARGLVVLPAGIDPHVHLSLPTQAGRSADDFSSGSRAALAGGVTQIIDFVTPLRNQPLTDALAQRQEESADCTVGLRFHMGISGWLPDMEQQIEMCVKEHRIKSFKTYLAYRNHIGIGYEELKKVMQIAAKLNAIVLIHAEEDDAIESLRAGFLQKGLTHPRYHALSRPPLTESRAVQKAIQLIRETGCTTYFVHISTAESADLIAAAKKEGLPVLAETCPQYLLLDDTVYEGSFDKTAPFVFSPPARPSYHSEKLWQHLQQGTFDTVATDHCPFSMQQKRAGSANFSLIPNGAGGLEFRIPLIYHFGVNQHRISLQQWVQLTSTRAATIFDIPSKGRIQVGYDADILLFNPNATTTLSASKQQQNCDINIYEGTTITGKTHMVLVNGEVGYKLENATLQ